MDSNLIKNSKFGVIKNGAPEFWDAKYPREELKPKFDFYQCKLCITGNSNPYAFGSWVQPISVEEGVAYKFKVKFSIEGIEDLNLNVFNVIFWSRGDPQSETCTYDHISNYYREGELIVGEDVFKVPPGFRKAEIQLGFRFSENGKVWWE